MNELVGKPKNDYRKRLDEISSRIAQGMIASGTYGSDCEGVSEDAVYLASQIIKEIDITVEKEWK